VVFCTAVRVAPQTLFVGRKTTLTIRISQNGKAVKGIRIKIKGSTLNLTTKASQREGHGDGQGEPEEGRDRDHRPDLAQGLHESAHRSHRRLHAAGDRLSMVWGWTGLRARPVPLREPQKT
jgi:hypothetical protein